MIDGIQLARDLRQENKQIESIDQKEPRIGLLKRKIQDDGLKVLYTNDDKPFNRPGNHGQLTHYNGSITLELNKTGAKDLREILHEYAAFCTIRKQQQELDPGKLIEYKNELPINLTLFFDLIVGGVLDDNDRIDFSHYGQDMRQAG